MSLRFLASYDSTDFVPKSVESNDEAVAMQHRDWVLVIVGVLIAVIGLHRTAIAQSVLRGQSKVDYGQLDRLLSELTEP